MEGFGSVEGGCEFSNFILNFPEFSWSDGETSRKHWKIFQYNRFMTEVYSKNAILENICEEGFKSQIWLQGRIECFWTLMLSMFHSMQ